MEDKNKKQEDITNENIDDANKKFGIEENIGVNEKEASYEEKRENEIELRLQEIDIEMDKLDMRLSLNEDDDDAIIKYEELKKEIKELLKERKNLRKKENLENYDPNVKSLDALSVWIIIYGGFVSLLCSPLMSSIWIKFAQMIINVASDTIGAMDPSTVLGKTMVILLVFAFPLLLHVISWVLYLNVVKSKTDKFAFRIAWICQAVCTIITMIIAIVSVVQN